jgi:hypothetical protein
MLFNEEAINFENFELSDALFFLFLNARPLYIKYFD